jgi:prepilin-type N-terminal cleavage/methylation domain-containing protein
MTATRNLLVRIHARMHGDERGFSMVEVVVAIALFAILATGIASMQNTTLNLIRNDRHRSVAANLAASEMDTVRSTPFASLPLGQQVEVHEVGRVPYTVTRESEWVAEDASAGACEAPEGSEPAFLRVEVRVTWPTMNSIPPVESNTVVAPPVGTYDVNTGHLAVKVFDRDGLPQEGMPVALTGPASLNQSTSAEGCVFFAFLAPGAYTATLAQTGYVDDQGVASPSQTGTVITSATASLAFLYDRSASLELTLVGKDLGASAPSGVPVTLANTHILPTGIQMFPAEASPVTITGRFPFADGYQAWAGGCEDADPAFHGGERSPPIAMEPGQSSTGTIGMPEIRMTVVDGLGQPVPGGRVDVVHAPDLGCPSGEAYEIGIVDASGVLAFALPYGTWTVELDDEVVGIVTLSPTAEPPGPSELGVLR